MHTSSNIIGDTLAILRDTFAGPTYAYPDRWRVHDWWLLRVEA